MPIEEGKVKKGGVNINKTPNTNRPRPPMGQDYNMKCVLFLDGVGTKPDIPKPNIIPPPGPPPLKMSGIIHITINLNDFFITKRFIKAGTDGSLYESDNADKPLSQWVECQRKP